MHTIRYQWITQIFLIFTDFFDFCLINFGVRNLDFWARFGPFGWVSMPDLNSGRRDLRFGAVKVKCYAIFEICDFFEISKFLRYPFVSYGTILGLMTLYRARESED